MSRYWNLDRIIEKGGMCWHVESAYTDDGMYDLRLTDWTLGGLKKRYYARRFDIMTIEYIDTLTEGECLALFGVSA